jgi:transcription initiation factor TFIIIB Brf1 subunit/transcription initiation factor TFIIB
LCPVVADARERIFGSDPGRIAAIAVLSDSSLAGRPTAEELRELYELTPTLAKLAASLASGRTIRDYAIEAGVTEGTARQQLKELFLRTETSRQADLVRVMLASVATLLRPK